ncbi:hypothetical protein L6452_27916 [Arctium lappa]|uniref:Uncharacterized protein n=1 Tax=Arctium lappa TaxID=4217 RepID=A0ACB9A1C5_ARCLA|nr:hypothetical protein L6452_27916 [Arctium lappa]
MIRLCGGTHSLVVDTHISTCTTLNFVLLNQSVKLEYISSLVGALINRRSSSSSSCVGSELGVGSSCDCTPKPVESVK